MKYMGSKRAMLRNGLGEALYREARGRRRIVDLFCGSGAVAWFVAENIALPVLAVDLQEYAVTLARSVVQRETSLDSEDLALQWLDEVEAARRGSALWEAGRCLEAEIVGPEILVERTRALGKSLDGL